MIGVKYGLIAAALLGMLLAPSMALADDAVLVFAAASLKNALDDADAAYLKESGVKVTASYAASGPLAKQIEAGAPADLFISADTVWMDDVAAKGLITAGTRRDLLGNSLVLVAPAGSKAAIVLQPGAALAPLLGDDGRLAIGDPKSVPAGQYGKQALESLGLWDQIKDHLAEAENVRAGLLLVSRGETPLGIVYATDAHADPSVRIVATFPESSHPPIVYPAALIAASHNPAAAKFLTWLESPAAAGFFTKQGFTVLK